jgi:hypothetical protein
MSPIRLEQECRSYTMYLTGQLPHQYVIGKYVEYHSRCGARMAPIDAFDQFLTGISVRGAFGARLADTYASRFHKEASLRKKLVLMLALLESSAESFEYLDAPGRGGIPAALCRLTGLAAVYAGTMVLAILLFLPVQVWTAVFARSGNVPAMEN